MAWSLYAPRVAKTEIYLHDDYAPRADEDAATGESESRDAFVGFAPPEVARPFLTNHSRQGWRLLRADLWSLSATHSPIAPQSRFQLAVASWLADEMATASKAEPLSTNGNVKVERWGPADRWTGARERLPELIGRDAIREATGRHWLHAQPRETARPAASADVHQRTNRSSSDGE